MHIYVHLGRVAIEEQQGEREARRRHQIVISGGERVQQQPIPNQPPVHKYKDGIAVVFLHLRARGETAKREPARLVVGVGVRRPQHLRVRAEIDQVFQDLAAEDLKHAFPRRLDRRRVQQVGRAVPKLERLIGMRQRIVCHQRRDMREFRLFRPQKFLARRDIEK